MPVRRTRVPGQLPRARHGSTKRSAAALQTQIHAVQDTIALIAADINANR